MTVARWSAALLLALLGGPLTVFLWTGYISPILRASPAVDLGPALLVTGFGFWLVPLRLRDRLVVALMCLPIVAGATLYALFYGLCWFHGVCL